MSDLNTGLVIYAHAGSYEVQSGSQRVICLLRGRLKREKLYTDLLVAGDRVRWRLSGPGRGIIEEILPRDSQLSRPRPGSSVTEDLIMANPDQAVFVFSVRQPEPNLRLLDRFLVVAEANELPAVICANKVDLLGADENPGELFGLYEAIGYVVIYTSAVSGQGVAALRKRLRGKLSVLTGPSGAGKTSLLNSVQPELGLATGQISQSTGKGRHTTVSIRLFPLDTSGYVADTPGLRSLALWDTEPEELDGYFPELAPLVTHCQFSDCSHKTEPGCAVRAAVEAGQVRPERYDSYLRLRAGEE